MKILSSLAHALVAGAIAATPAVADKALADEVLGTWLSEDSDLAIEIAACDAGLCGTVVWADGDDDLVGRRLLVDVPASPDDEGVYQGGRYDDPSVGKTMYRCRLQLDAEGRLQLKGVAGVQRRGRVVTSRFTTTRVWTRVDLADLGQ